MRCLKCWETIQDVEAYYTKSCDHVFCEECGKTSLCTESSCPFCQMVLPKDGYTKILLKPREEDVVRASQTLLGFHPDEMCNVLQIGLQFWARQKGNHDIYTNKQLEDTQKQVQQMNATNVKLTQTLEDERVKKRSLQLDKEDLKKQIADLESRYAEKARAMRKLRDAYDDLRKVHRKLETDLREGGSRREMGGDIAVVKGTERPVSSHAGRKGSFTQEIEERLIKGPERSGSGHQFDSLGLHHRELRRKRSTYTPRSSKSASAGLGRLSSSQGTRPIGSTPRKQAFDLRGKEDSE